MIVFAGDELMVADAISVQYEVKLPRYEYVRPTSLDEEFLSEERFHCVCTSKWTYFKEKASVGEWNKEEGSLVFVKDGKINIDSKNLVMTIQ